MEIYLIYLVKVITLQTMLFGLYWLINRKGTNFQFNRYFLLATLVLPFFIPLIRVPFLFFGNESSANNAFDPWYFIEQSLPLVTIKGSRVVSYEFTRWTVFILLIYLAIAVPSTIKMILDYMRIVRLEKTKSRSEFTPRGFRLFYVPSKILSFSFINRIFLSDLFPIKSNEKNTIITHEEYHLTQYHSLDIILAELVRIICWFNPVVHYIQKNLKETHEYLADRHTIGRFGKNDYANLLKSFKWHEINLLLGSAYSGSSIKDRIKMIEQDKKRSPILQVLILSTIAIFTAFLFACENELDSFENKDANFHYELSEADLEREISDRIVLMENAPQDLVNHYAVLQRKHPNYIYLPSVMYVTAQQLPEFSIEKLKTLKSLNNIEFDIEYSRMLSEDETIEYFTNGIKNLNIVAGYVIIQRADRKEYMESVYKMNEEDNSIHEDFDKMASFKGGMEALIRHLNENLTYPELARERGIEDRVVMQFVISKFGGLIYLNIEQEPATSDEEVSLELQRAAFAALRTTEGLWEPAEKNGRYVMTKMTLPIEFKLAK